ncbi:MAG: PLP-dependent aminotransferase family protein [Alphaproteobacteria bacterium]|nr:MAG: PLP-dependent aminotransferase family protein [Alphaproteobacteria bacterium]
MLRPWKIQLESIDSKSDTPLYMQIVHAVIHEIRRGRLSPGDFMPSSRELAESLGVNRKTIVLAYEDLIAQGWLASRGTRGTIVSTDLPEQSLEAPKAPEPTAGQAGFHFRAAPGVPFALSASSPLVLDEGSPDCRLFPYDVLIRAYRSAILRAKRANRLKYGDPRGSAILRESLVGMLKSQRGLALRDENLCITRGSQMGVFLASRVLVEPGDTVLMETLSYTPAAQAFRAAGATVIPVRLDRDGIDVAELERLCGEHRVRAVFLTPHHQFPTTVALRPERRLRLIELARRFSFAIIEDDYDHEYHFEGQPLLPIASYCPEQTVYIGSLSKLTLPSLRLGYIAAPPKVIDAMVHELMLLDRQGNTPTEEAVAELIELGELRRHVRKMKQTYTDRRAAFIDGLQRNFGDLAEFDVPDGGLAVWLRFADTAILDRIDRNQARHGVRTAQSTSFAVSPATERGIRAGFASLNEAEAADALMRLRKAAVDK